MCFGRVSSSYSTSGTRRVNLVKAYKNAKRHSKRTSIAGCNYDTKYCGMVHR